MSEGSEIGSRKRERERERRRERERERRKRERERESYLSDDGSPQCVLDGSVSSDGLSKVASGCSEKDTLNLSLDLKGEADHILMGERGGGREGETWLVK